MLSRFAGSAFRSAVRGSARPTVACLQQPQRCRTFAFNIWDESPQRHLEHKGTTRQVAEEIFLQHANMGESLQPGLAFKAACHSLAKEYRELEALENVALEGRAWEIMDENGDNVISKDEWIGGVEEMLNPKSKKWSGLKERLEAGNVSHGLTGDFSEVKRVAIIGGGVAGLQTARALSKIGKEVVIFEKGPNIGGVWRENYADFGLQVPKELYEFPEFPYPSDGQFDKFPSGPQVQQYIERYAEHFGIDKIVRLNTGVTEIKSAGSSSSDWSISFGKKGEDLQEERFDFVVVSTGMYGWPPHIPQVRGRSEFKGEVLHSCTFTDNHVAAGKKVVVVGGGKSAVDNAVSAARVGTSSTLLFREAHWPVPRHLCNLVPFKWGTYSRFGHFMLPVHYNVSNVAWYMHSILTPVKWFWWRVVELMFRAQFRLTGDLVPTTPIEYDVFGGGQILNYNFRDMLKTGQVKARKGSVEKFTQDGVILQDGSELECDLVVFGTGFTKNYDLFDRLLQNKMEKHNDGLYLYRNVIAPRLPNVAFVGCEVSTFNNILTHGLQAEWLAKVLDGKIVLPTTGRMLKQIEKEQAWKRTWMPGTSARASIFQLHMMKYHDQLVADMKENPKRKGFNVLAEAFSPYDAKDYAALFKI